MPDRLSTLKHDAEWAEFAAPTNLAQRQRAERDKEAYAQELVAEQERQTLDRLSSDQTAQNLFFRSKELKLKSDLQQDKLRRAEEIHTLNLEKTRAQTRAADALARSRTKAEILAHDTKTRLLEDEDNFATAVTDRQATGLKPGTTEWRDFVIDRSAVYPGASKLATTLLRNAGIEMTPEEIAEKQAAMRAAVGPNATINATSGGKISVSSKAEGAPKNDTQKRIDNLKDAYAKSYDDLPEETRAAMLNRIKELETGAPSTTPSATPATTSVTPTPSQAPDRRAIAQKALNDPNASEQHKAAAKRILGIQ